MIIAVASQSGKTVDQHFGQAESFKIFDYKSSNPQQISEVAVEPFSQKTPDHSFDEQRFKQTVSALEGCKALVVSQIGEVPAQHLRQAGITPVQTDVAIIEALKFAHDSVCTGQCKAPKNMSACPHK